MTTSLHLLWVGPLALLLLWWAACGLIAIKGLLFHRQPRRELPAALVIPETGEVLRQPGLGGGCLLCLLFLFWPLWLAAKIDAWLPPPR